jgi:hypothetical protein
MDTLRFSLLRFSPYSSRNIRIIQYRMRHVRYDATEQKFVQGFGAKTWWRGHCSRNLRADGGHFDHYSKSVCCVLRPKLYCVIPCFFTDQLWQMHTSVQDVTLRNVQCRAIRQQPTSNLRSNKFNGTSNSPSTLHYQTLAISVAMLKRKSFSLSPQPWLTCVWQCVKFIIIYTAVAVAVAAAVVICQAF